jgi:hypothetical protein
MAGVERGPGGLFLEVDWAQRAKRGQGVAGDTVLVRRLPEEGRLVAVLADGLGSGVKAAVLSTLTATIALRHTAAGRDVRRSAELIARTLPVCSVRRIGYSTFTIVDVQDDGYARVFNSGNPHSIWMHGRSRAHYEAERIDLGDERELRATELMMGEGDHLVVCSDGVTQAGMGRDDLPFGWGAEGLEGHLTQALAGDARLSARSLAAGVVEAAVRVDDGAPHDDTTCLDVQLRRPRRLTVITGPPYEAERDGEIASLCVEPAGRVAICGGTTAEIIGRELGRRVDIDLRAADPEIPPMGELEGVDLVTEGMITLAAVQRLLEAGQPWPGGRDNGATRLAELLLDSDIIDFVVGTRVNGAHQDPSLPMELGIRRNLLRGLVTILRERYARQVSLRFL